MYHGHTSETQFQQACREQDRDPQIMADKLKALSDNCECTPRGTCWACQQRIKLEKELGINQDIPF